MEKRFKIRKKESNKATDPELDQLNALVEGKLERRKLAVPKSGFAYFHYENKGYLGGLEAFCAPYEVQKTKRFKRTGVVNFLTPSGAKAVNQGDYVLKLTGKNFVVLDEVAFSELFKVKWFFME